MSDGGRCPAARSQILPAGQNSPEEDGAAAPELRFQLVDQAGYFGDQVASGERRSAAIKTRLSQGPILSKIRSRSTCALGKHTGTRLAGERGAPVLFGQTGRPLVENRSQRLARRKGRLETTAGPKSSIGRIAAPQSLNQKIWDTPAIDEIRSGANQMNSRACNFLDLGHAANVMSAVVYRLPKKQRRC